MSERERKRESEREKEKEKDRERKGGRGSNIGANAAIVHSPSFPPSEFLIVCFLSPRSLFPLF